MNTLLLSALLALSFTAATQETPPVQPRSAATPAAVQNDADAGRIAFQRACYPLEKCVACNEALGDKAVDFLVDGKLVRTCCSECRTAVAEKKAEVLKRIDAAVIAAQMAAYPLEKCPISEEKLGGMGEPVDLVVGMRLVRLCCKNCVGKVEKNPEPTFGKLERAYIASQKPKYTVKACPVCAQALDEAKAVDALYGTTLVRLCCEECKTALNRTPTRVLARLATLKEGKPLEADAPRKEGEQRGG